MNGVVYEVEEAEIQVLHRLGLGIVHLTTFYD